MNDLFFQKKNHFLKNYNKKSKEEKKTKKYKNIFF